MKEETHGFCASCGAVALGCAQQTSSTIGDMALRGLIKYLHIHLDLKFSGAYSDSGSRAA